MISTEQFQRILRKMKWPANVKRPLDVRIKALGEFSYQCFLGRYPLLVNVFAPTPEAAFRWAVDAFVNASLEEQSIPYEKGSTSAMLARTMAN